MGRVLSSFGIGAGTVETVLPKHTVQPGETIDVRVDLTGGDTDQAIEDVYFQLTSVADGETVVLDEFEIDESFTLAAEESKTFRTETTIPPWTPLTRNGQRVTLKTGLDISWALDPTDEAELDVVADPYASALFAAVTDLGFTERDVSIERPTWLDDTPILQRYEYEPGPDRPDLDCVALMCLPRGDDLRVLFTVDEGGAGDDAIEQNSHRQELSITFDTPSAKLMRQRLNAEIDRHTRR